MKKIFSEIELSEVCVVKILFCVCVCGFVGVYLSFG